MALVPLNVGGTGYTTTAATLCRFPNSMLARMFEGDLLPTHKDSKGRCALIDRPVGQWQRVTFHRQFPLASLRNFGHFFPPLLGETLSIALRREHPRPQA